MYYNYNVDVDDDDDDDDADDGDGNEDEDADESLRNRNVHGRQAVDTRFVRACAVEMHMEISHEPFCLEIYREHVGR